MTGGLEDHLRHQTDLAAGFFWHRLRWRSLRPLVPDRDVTVLDVGAGTGVLGQLMAADRPAATYLFDEPIASLSEDLERRFGAAANHRARPRWDDVDTVTLLDVIEHLDEPRSLLADICARCRPGTVIAITVPASERLWSQWDVALGHRRRYTRRSLGELLGTLPVEVDEVSWLFPELVPPALWRARRHPPRDAAPGEAGDGDGDVAELPELPRLLNDLLYLLGLGPLLLRRWVPFGTSLLAVARVTGPGSGAASAPAAGHVAPDRTA